MAASRLSKIKIFFACMSFFYDFYHGWNITKIWDYVKNVKPWFIIELCGVAFWVFKDCLRILWDVCGSGHVWNCPYYKWGYRLWVLCSYFDWFTKVLMWSTNYCFGMHKYVWWRIRGTTSGEEDFLKIEKAVLIMGKNALTVFIHGLNVYLCSYLKYCGAFFHVL